MNKQHQYIVVKNYRISTKKMFKKKFHNQKKNRWNDLKKNEDKISIKVTEKKLLVVGWTDLHFRKRNNQTNEQKKIEKNPQI